jgi:hypothetical protein
MKHLLSGVALAALLAAGLPAIAQTSSGDGAKQPAAPQSGTAATGSSTSMPAGTDNRQSGATTAPSADAATGSAKKSKTPAAADAQSGTTATGSGATTSSDSIDKSSKSARKGGAAKHESSASDNMAEQLNREELRRVQNGSQTSGSGQSQAPAATPSGGKSGSGTR